MALPEQKKKLLKAKIAVALHDELGRVPKKDALLTVLKKWTLDLSMPGVASRRHIFEANVNWFTMALQVHGAKPLDDLA